MQILFLSAWRPWPADNGTKLRKYHLLRGLAQNHHVDLVCFSPQHTTPEQEEHLRSFCRVVRVLHDDPFAGRAVGRLVGLFSLQPRSMVGNFNPAMADLVRQQSNSQHYDVIVAAELHMTPYALLIQGTPMVLEELELARIIEQYRSERHPVRRFRYALTWWKTRTYVRSLLRRFAAVTLVSEAERVLIASDRRPGLAIGVVPNGVDLAACSGNFGPPEADTLIYPGALSFDANFDAVSYFIAEVLPLIRKSRPSARLLVTGKATPEQIAALPGRDGVEFTGYLEDIRPAIGRAWAEVVPLRIGSGTRLKVLEAMALGTPVVSTTKGVEGIDLLPGRDCLIGDTPHAFAARTIELLASFDLRQKLADAGRRLAARYDWQHSVQALNEIIDQAAAARSPGAVRARII